MHEKIEPIKNLQSDNSVGVKPALETYYLLFETYLRKNVYKDQTYRVLLDAFDNDTYRENVESQIRGRLSWFERIKRNLTTDISVTKKLKCFWDVLNYTGNVQGLVTRLSTLQKALGWFSLLGWRLWYMQVTNNQRGLYSHQCCIPSYLKT